MDDDPFAVRPNAPISVVKAAKASLREPTRPQTPSSESARQLFTRESEFAQNRPSSAYGTPGSKLFFEGGSKLSIAKLDPFARGESITSSAAGGRGRSILEQGPGAVTSPWRDVGSRSLTRTGSQQGDSYGGSDRPSAESLLLQHQATKGRPTAAETVQALKASIAAAEAGVIPHHEIFGAADALTEGRIPSSSMGARPSSAQGGSTPLDGVHSPWTPGGRGSSQQGSAQVLEIGTPPQYSDDDDDDSVDDYYQRYQAASDTQQRQQQQQQFESSQPQQAEQQQVLVVLDPSEEFLQWRGETEAVLQQLATATAAFASAGAASGSGGGGGAAGGRPGTASRGGSASGGAAAAAAVKEALAEVMQQCSRLLGCVVSMRARANASAWLNSSCSVYADARGVPLSMREAITELAFRLMDSHTIELLMRACSIILRVVRSRPPLLQAGKLLYRLSKDGSNDALFRREALLEPMLRTLHVMVASAERASTRQPPPTDPSTPAPRAHPGARQQAPNPSNNPSSTALYEPLVYYCGALKNISNDAHNQRALAKAGALHVLCSALRTMLQHARNAAPDASGRRNTPSPQATSTSTSTTTTTNSTAAGAGSGSGSSGAAGPSQVAVQITGVLRNLAVPPAHAPAFLAAGALPALKDAMRQLGASQELALNLGRVLSKLSLSEQCQADIEADLEYAPLLLSMLGRYVANGPMLIRLAFVIGNLTTTSDNYRMQVAQVPGALDLIVSSLQSYTEGTVTDSVASATKAPGSRAAAQGASREDCLVKLLRLVANLAINAKVGPGLAARPVLAACIMQILEAHEYAGDSEELVLNAVCATTNLSFYQGPENQLLQLEPSRLLRHVTPLLLSENEEAVVEAARAFGNLSRQPAAREYMVSARVLEALVLLLDHSSAEVLYSVCGTLINFSAESGRQSELLQLGAADRLVDVLMRCSNNAANGDQADTEVGTLCVVCKALFNLLAEGGKATPELVAAVEAALSSITQSGELMAHREVPQVTSRLSGLLARLQA